ncbi:unnamed protein product, partial [Effrenium voratum]
MPAMAGLVLALLGTAAGQFVVDKDYALADKADAIALSTCQDFVVLDTADKAAAKADLTAASGNNFLLEVLKNSGSDAALGDLMMNQVSDPSFILQKAGPLVAAFVFMGIYFLCCWWSACCKCCRCCRRDCNCGRICKMLFFILLGAIGVGLTVAAFLALRGLDAAQEGLERTACSSAQMVNATLSGTQ